MSPASPDTSRQSPSLGESFRLGDWLVSAHSGQIVRGGRILRIEPKAMDVLLYLAGRPGEVVSRE